MEQKKQLKIQDQCDSLDIIYPKETPTMDKYYLNLVGSIENYFNNVDNKKTPTIKREFKEIENNIFKYHKSGDISDGAYKEMYNRIEAIKEGNDLL